MNLDEYTTKAMQLAEEIENRQTEIDETIRAARAVWSTPIDAVFGSLYFNPNGGTAR